MSLRKTMPRPQASRSHYFVTFARGEKLRCFAISPWTLFGLLCAAPFVLCAYIGATFYLIYRDDLLASLMARQNEMQYAYEDRIAAMRTQLDSVTGRQLLDQNTIEGRVHELLSRQAQIESRAQIIQQLAQQTGANPLPAPPEAKPADAKGALNRVFAAPGAALRLGPPAPVGALNAPAYAPLDRQPSSSDSDKPRPEAPEQQGALGGAPDRMLATLTDASQPVEKRLGAISVELQQIEVNQIAAVEAVGSRAHRSAARLREAMRVAGLPVEKMMASSVSSAHDVGGPFVPLKVDPKGSLFEREVFAMQNDFAEAAVLTRAALQAPLRKPLGGPLTVTSPFGARVDPFFGRLATHTGVDLRENTGAQIHATAAGKVTIASWTGGYGNMVEIDHGNGLSTRYGHMSEIDVTPGQMISARDTIGRVGSTGRSTGSHLHYEVRVDGEPVDPMRFLNAGESLALND